MRAAGVIQLVLGVSALCALSSSCALRRGVGTEQALIVKGCQLPKDQTDSFLGKWTDTPIPLAFHQGEFSNDEMGAVASAIATWNSFFSGSVGYRTFDIGNATDGFHIASAPHPASFCGQSIHAGPGTGFSGPV